MSKTRIRPVPMDPEERERIEREARQPQPGTWAATAALMAEGDDSGFDWDAWKDEMKDQEMGE